MVFLKIVGDYPTGGYPKGDCPTGVVRALNQRERGRNWLEVRVFALLFGLSMSLLCRKTVGLLMPKSILLKSFFAFRVQSWYSEKTAGGQGKM